MYSRIHLFIEIPVVGKHLCQGWREFLRTRAQIVDNFRRNSFSCLWEWKHCEKWEDRVPGGEMKSDRAQGCWD
jgi:hypothetical protein